jgi:hypothetical protein
MENKIGETIHSAFDLTIKYATRGLYRFFLTNNSANEKLARFRKYSEGYTTSGCLVHLFHHYHKRTERTLFHNPLSPLKVYKSSKRNDGGRFHEIKHADPQATGPLSELVVSGAI